MKKVHRVTKFSDFCEIRIPISSKQMNKLIDVLGPFEATVVGSFMLENNKARKR